LFELAGRDALHVLGDVNVETPADEPFQPDDVHAFTSSNRYPRIHCPAESGVTAQVILFKRPYPRQMEFMSMTPISLVLEDNTMFWDGEGDAQDEIAEKEKQEKLTEKLKLHSVTNKVLTEKERSLQRVIDQINCSYETKELLEENAALLASRRLRRALSVSERIVEGGKSAWRTVLRMGVETVKFLWPFVTTAFVAIILFWRLVADMILRCLEWRLRPEYAALKDISATGKFPLSPGAVRRAA
jgi:phosphatidylinositol glycan class Q protein